MSSHHSVEIEEIFCHINFHIVQEKFEIRMFFHKTCIRAIFLSSSRNKSIRMLHVENVLAKSCAFFEIARDLLATTSRINNDILFVKTWCLIKCFFGKCR